MTIRNLYNNPFYVFVEAWDNGTWNLSVLNVFQFAYGVITGAISLDGENRFADFRFVPRSKIDFE